MPWQGSAFYHKNLNHEPIMKQFRCWEHEYPVFVKTLEAVPADKFSGR